MAREGKDWSGFISRYFDPPVFDSTMSYSSRNFPCSMASCVPKAAKVVTAFRFSKGSQAFLAGSWVSWWELTGVVIVHYILHLPLEDLLRVLKNLSFHLPVIVWWGVAARWSETYHGAVKGLLFQMCRWKRSDEVSSCWWGLIPWLTRKGD